MLSAGLLLALLAGGWLMSSPAKGPIEAGPVDTAALEGTGILDGMAFASELGPFGKPKDKKDTLVFAKGLFVSTECERECGYPARPYFVREVGDRVEFVSETRCPNKNARIVWRGSVHNGAIEGVFTWTVDRWYWTIEKQFSFAGRLVEVSPPLASSL